MTMVIPEPDVASSRRTTRRWSSSCPFSFVGAATTPTSNAGCQEANTALARKFESNGAEASDAVACWSWRPCPHGFARARPWFVAPRGWFSSRPRADIRWTEDFRPQIAPSLSRCRTVRSSARGGGRADSPAAKPETGCVRRTALRTRSEHRPNRWGVGRFRRVRVCPGNGEFCETVPDARPPSHGGNPGSNPGSGIHDLPASW